MTRQPCIDEFISHRIDCIIHRTFSNCSKPKDRQAGGPPSLRFHSLKTRLFRPDDRELIQVQLDRKGETQAFVVYRERIDSERQTCRTLDLL